jgi:hypothetical protein
MNVTLSIDEETLARARELAIRRGTSLNQMVRDYLEEVASDLSSEEILEELKANWEKNGGNSGGRRWTREEIHERSRVL